MITFWVTAVLAAGPHLYKVRPKDDAVKIAKANHLHAGECGYAILTYNSIADPKDLKIGSEVVVPVEQKHIVK
ncbi:MAG: hypothetical protein H7Z43_10285, partial [Clostridia bacterium]|nr:hypothetical protein [Deltaproteobacteria bacterium]